MLDESEEATPEVDDAESEESLAKLRFKLRKPNPMVYFIVGPFFIVFVIYVVLTKLLISSDLEHEAKLEQVMQNGYSETKSSSEQLGLDGDPTALSSESNQSEGGFLDIHNYFQFPVSFAVNIPDTSKNLTFDLAVSSFQSGVTAEWFYESFTAFVPAIRSDILYFMGKHSLEDLQSSEFQAVLLEDLKEVINIKLQSLGAKPEISKVMFVSFIVT